MKVLVLGGTPEARRLSEALGARAVLSLSGATKSPLTIPHRIGGFGGIRGLEAYLTAQEIGSVVDATHPFAAQMSHNAAAACTALAMPLLRLERPPWPEENTWIGVETLAAAAEAIPHGARVFLSVGRQSLAPFLGREDMWCLSRSIEPPLHAPKGKVIVQRPPFTLESEVALMKTHRISHLVAKNAGGGATKAKLEAAARCGVQVIMVKRPRLSEALTVESVSEAVRWVENLGE